MLHSLRKKHVQKTKLLPKKIAFSGNFFVFCMQYLNKMYHSELMSVVNADLKHYCLPWVGGSHPAWPAGGLWVRHHPSKALKSVINPDFRHSVLQAAARLP